MNPETQAAVALLAAGLGAQHLEYGLTLVGATSMSTPEEVEASVAALLGDLPSLFDGAGDGSRSSPAHPSNVTPIKRDTSKTAAERAQERFDATERSLASGESAYDRGRRLARERYPELAGQGGGAA